MIFYGLADAQVQEVVELFATRGQEEEALAQALADEPEWVDSLSVVELDLGGTEPIVRPS